MNKNNKIKSVSLALLFLSFISIIPTTSYAIDNDTNIEKVNYSEYTRSDFEKFSTEELIKIGDLTDSQVALAKRRSDGAEKVYKYHLITAVMGSFVEKYKYDIDLTTPSKDKIPKDGDEGRLNIGWTVTVPGFAYCRDSTLTKVNDWQLIDGYWYHFTDYVADFGWFNDNGIWYYFDETTNVKENKGKMKTGWINDKGTWYYLKSSGAMATGWINDNGTWYYLNNSGAMLSNTTIDGYRLGSNGAWIK